mmetsp:Transcript_38761/g.100994  ORF Transcript_38761/g.100994 Transcript_38761/m.100994 type:complete len:415 (-) Transcript_38761:1743-2987(-)
MFGHAQQHTRGTWVVASLDQTLDDHVGVQDHDPAPQLLRQRQLLPPQVLVAGQEELVRRLVVAVILLLPRYHKRCVCSLQVVAQDLVQLANVHWRLRHIVGVTHKVGRELVRQCVVARLPSDLNRVVDLLLADLKVELEGRVVLPAERIVFGCLRIAGPLFVVSGNDRVLLLVAMLPEMFLIVAHGVVPLGQLERSLVHPGQQEELDCARDVALAHAVIRHPLSPGRQPSLTDQLKSPCWLIEFLQAQPHHTVQVSRSLVGFERLVVCAAGLLRLCKLHVDHGRMYLAHEGSRSVEVELVDVQVCCLVEGTGLDVHLCRLGELPHAHQRLGAVLANGGVAERLGGLHPLAQVAEPHRRACDPCTALVGVIWRCVGAVLAAAGGLVVVEGLLVLPLSLQCHGALQVDRGQPLRSE